nr:sugar transporter ERD6-like 7 [Tanacetum cinerariifolium]
KSSQDRVYQTFCNCSTLGRWRRKGRKGSQRAKIGKQKEFEAALRKLRGKEADVSAEADEIQDYIETLQKLPKAKIFDLFQRRYLRSVTVSFSSCQIFFVTTYKEVTVA